jgi:transcriptional regulator with XRE-family HTH domain
MGTLAYCIKKKLDEKGISAYKLEKKVGLKRSAINNILYGKSKSPGIEIIQSIAKGLNCSISELLGDSATPFELDQVTNGRDPLLRYIPIYESPENMHLYLSTLSTIGPLLEENNISLTREEIFHCIEETYSYSLKTNEGQIDSHFLGWIVNKFKLFQKRK